MNGTVRKPKGDGDPAEVRRSVDELVRRVPQHALLSVIKQLDNSAAPGDMRAQALRGALVEKYNHMRPLKARRLFTSLFEPLLVDDQILYRSREPVPGVVQRVDIGGLWASLSKFAFPKMAAEVQFQLENMSLGVLLDDVLESQDALVMRRALCDEAVAYLADLPTKRKALAAFLELLNQEAFDDACHRSPHLTNKIPIDPSQLAFYRAILEESSGILPVLTRLGQEIGDRPPVGDQRAAEVDSQAAMLVAVGREMRAACPKRTPMDPVVWLPALIALNVKQRYDVVQRYLREYAGPSSIDTHPLHLAVFGHFAACSQTLAEVTAAVFNQQQVREGRSLAMPRPVRDLLEQAVRRFERSLHVLNSGGLMTNRTIGPRVRPTLADITAILVGTVMPVCAERAVAALNARNFPEPDHDDLIWLLELMSSWSATLGTLGYAGNNTRELKARMRQEAQGAFLAAIKMAPDDLPERRIDHVVRINQILSAIGDNIGPWISPVSQGLQNMVRFVLEFGRERTPAVDFIVDRYIAAVRNELGRSRHWQSAELVSLLKLYEDRTT